MIKIILSRFSGDYNIHINDSGFMTKQTLYQVRVELANIHINHSGFMAKQTLQQKRLKLTKQGFRTGFFM